MLKRLSVLTFILLIGLSSCNIPHPSIENKEETEGEDLSQERSQYEGYLFILDEGLSFNGKLYGISPEGSVSEFPLTSSTGIEPVGTNGRLQQIGRHLIIYSVIDSKDQVTVVDAQTLQVVSQSFYNFKNGWTYDFMEAISEDKAIIGSDGSEFYSVDLKSGEIALLSDRIVFNSWAYPVSYDGLLFLASEVERVILVFDANDPTNIQKINVPKPIRRLERLNSTMLLARTFESECYVVSMKDRKIIKKVDLDIPSSLYRHSIIGDTEGRHLFFAGKDADKDKIFFYDLSVERPVRKLFYTIPTEDININHPITGSIKMGITADKNQFYIAHISDHDPYRGVRLGFISRISMDGVYDRVPITKPDEKIKLESIQAFTPFVSSKQ